MTGHQKKPNRARCGRWLSAPPRPLAPEGGKVVKDAELRAWVYGGQLSAEIPHLLQTDQHFVIWQTNPQENPVPIARNHVFCGPPGGLEVPAGQGLVLDACDAHEGLRINPLRLNADVRGPGVDQLVYVIPAQQCAVGIQVEPGVGVGIERSQFTELLNKPGAVECRFASGDSHPVHAIAMASPGHSLGRPPRAQGRVPPVVGGGKVLALGASEVASRHPDGYVDVAPPRLQPPRGRLPTNRVRLRAVNDPHRRETIG